MPTLKRKTFDKQVTCLLPVNLLPSTLRKEINTFHKKPITDVQFWRYLRFIDLLTSERKMKADGWVTLWHRILIINFTSEYLTVAKDLRALGVVEVYQSKNNKDRYVVNNNESKRYRLTDTFRSEPLVLITAFKRVNPSNKVKVIEDERVKLLLNNASTPEYAYLKGCLHKLRYDVDAVEADFNAWLANGVKLKGVVFNEVTREMMLRTVTSLNSDEIRFSVGASKRVSTDLTSSYKVLRRRLKIDGYEGVIKQADVSSTQIILMLPDMREYKNQLTNLKRIDELNHFESMLKTGQFYSVLAEQLEAEGVVVNDLKKDFLRLVCNYREGNSQSPYYKAFAKLYPTVTEFLKVLKNGKSFTTIMTPLEAELFNNRIARRVYHEIGSQTFLGGIYDAFIFREADEAGIVQIMNEEVYKMTGLADMVKVTTLKEESEKHIKYPDQPQEENQLTELTEEEKYAYDRIIKAMNESGYSHHIDKFKAFDLKKIKQHCQAALIKIREADRMKSLKYSEQPVKKTVTENQLGKEKKASLDSRIKENNQSEQDQKAPLSPLKDKKLQSAPVLMGVSQLQPEKEEIPPTTTKITPENDDNEIWSYADALERIQHRRKDFDRLSSELIENLVAMDWGKWNVYLPKTRAEFRKELKSRTENIRASKLSIAS